MHDFESFYVFSDFLVRADISAEQEIFWQVSDFLSRKNISDPAEHLRQTQNLKTQNNVILCIKSHKIIAIWKEKKGFWMSSEFYRIVAFFNA